MKYQHIVEGIFISRPNRFIAHVEVMGQTQICHVKNTGRCKELLLPGVRVLLDKAQNPNRKTSYDLIAVYKNDRLINMDSQAPNKVFREFVEQGGFGKGITHIQGESTYKNSRFDFYLEGKDDQGKLRKIYVETKGVTLEEDGVCRFPDAPTQRGVKHLMELLEAAKEGYEVYAVFVIQMEDVSYFEPNDKTHPEFGEMLREAAQRGVQLLALDCQVMRDQLRIGKEVAIKL